MSRTTADQLDTDAILQAADHAPPAKGLDHPREASESRGAAAPPTEPAQDADATARTLRLRVPVIVQLACRMMPMGAVRDLAVGAIVEFDKPVDDPLDLLVNNHPIGRGICVKVGENFGLRITQICDARRRVLSMGD